MMMLYCSVAITGKRCMALKLKDMEKWIIETRVRDTKDFYGMIK